MAGKHETDAEMLRLYWQTQWDRIGKLEDSRLQFTNFVIGASVVVIGLNVASEGLSAWTSGLVSGAVAVANLLAAWYCHRTERAVRMHQARSDLLLKENWPYLYDVKDRAGVERSILGRPRAVLTLGGGPYGFTLLLQQGLHLVMVAVSAGLVLIAATG